MYAEASEPGGVLLDEDIDGEADEIGGSEVEEGAADGAEGGGEDSGLEGFGVAQEVTQKMS